MALLDTFHLNTKPCLLYSPQVYFALFVLYSVQFFPPKPLPRLLQHGPCDRPGELWWGLSPSSTVVRGGSTPPPRGEHEVKSELSITAVVCLCYLLHLSTVENPLS